MKIKLTEVEPLELEFKDGSMKRAKFNVRCLVIFAEKYGDLPSTEDVMQDPITHMAKILHCGFIAAGDTDVDLDTCINLLNSDYGDLIAMYINNLMRETFASQLDEDGKKKFIAMIEKAELEIMGQMLN